MANTRGQDHLPHHVQLHATTPSAAFSFRGKMHPRAASLLTCPTGKQGLAGLEGVSQVTRGSGGTVCGVC